MGTILYACYGSLSDSGAESALCKKIEEDFNRALSSYLDFKTWRFITNRQAGQRANTLFNNLRRKHEQASERPMVLELIDNSNKFWKEYIRDLSPKDLDEIFPGCPGARGVELKDMVPLLENLANLEVEPDYDVSTAPVPFGKMEFNNLSESAKAEFQAGRKIAPIIDRWFSGHGNPKLKDEEAGKFRALYKGFRKESEDSGEILERLYVALGGSNFRLDGKRANGVYAITSYFFDECTIFEEPDSDPQ